MNANDVWGFRAARRASGFLSERNARCDDETENGHQIKGYGKTLPDGTFPTKRTAEGNFISLRGYGVKESSTIKRKSSLQ